jgi:small subunit ribosomal protein S15
MLKYLKRQSAQRYASLLARIGVEARAVEGELMLGGMPKQRRT